MSQITRDHCSELISALKQTLIEEYADISWLNVDTDTYNYFKKRAVQDKKEQSPQTSEQPQARTKPLIIEQTPSPKMQSQPIKNTIPAKEPAPIAAAEKPIPPASQQNAAPAKVATTDKKKSFVREPLSPPTASDFTEMRKYFVEKFPLIPLEDAIPSDKDAKDILRKWQASLVKPEVLILSFSETPREKAFLNNLKNAISRILAPARIINAIKIEEEKSWNRLLESEKLRLVIASNYSLYSLADLMNHFKEEPNSGKHFLGRVRLHLLPDISLYLQEPKLKAALWRTIQELLITRNNAP